MFGSKLGWERPNWFAPLGVEARDRYSMDGQNWFEQVAREHRAVREQAGLFDQSSSPNTSLRAGTPRRRCRGSAPTMSWPPGRVTYTQMLNTRGGIECDLTVSRLAEHHFYIVTGTGFRTHDLAWIRHHIKPGADARLSDVTEEWAPWR